MKRLIRCRAGNTALQFAVILPVVALVILSACTAGIYLGVSTSLQRMVVDVARSGVAEAQHWEYERAVRKFVAANGAAYFLLDPAHVVTTSVSRERASRIVVSITYDASWLPVWSLAGILPLPDPLITRTAEVSTAR